MRKRMKGMKATAWSLRKSGEREDVVQETSPDKFTVAMNDYYEKMEGENRNFSHLFFSDKYNVVCSGMEWGLPDFIVAMWHMSFYAPSMSGDAESIVRDWFKPSPSADTLDAFFISDDEVLAQECFIQLAQSYGISLNELALNMSNAEAIGVLTGAKSFMQSRMNFN